MANYTNFNNKDFPIYKITLTAMYLNVCSVMLISNTCIAYRHTHVLSPFLLPLFTGGVEVATGSANELSTNKQETKIKATLTSLTSFKHASRRTG